MAQEIEIAEDARQSSVEYARKLEAKSSRVRRLQNILAARRVDTLNLERRIGELRRELDVARIELAEAVDSLVSQAAQREERHARVRELEAKLLDVAEASERETAAARSVAETMIEDNARLVASLFSQAEQCAALAATLAALPEGTIAGALERAKLGLALKAELDDAVAENIRLDSRVKELIAELEQERKWHYEQADKAHAAEQANTPLKEALRVAADELKAIQGQYCAEHCEWVMTGDHDVVCRRAAIADADARRALFPESPSGTVPAVDGTRSDNTSIRQLVDSYGFTRSEGLDGFFERERPLAELPDGRYRVEVFKEFPAKSAETVTGADECTGCGARFNAPKGRAVPVCDACIESAGEREVRNYGPCVNCGAPRGEPCEEWCAADDETTVAP